MQLSLNPSDVENISRTLGIEPGPAGLRSANATHVLCRPPPPHLSSFFVHLLITVVIDQFHQNSLPMGSRSLNAKMTIPQYWAQTDKAFKNWDMRTCLTYVEFGSSLDSKKARNPILGNVNRLSISGSVCLNHFR